MFEEDTVGDESPHQDDAFWSLAVNRDRPSPADAENPGSDAPVDHVVRPRVGEATHAETASRARTLRFVLPRGPSTSTHGAAVNEQPADSNPVSVAGHEKRAAAGALRAQSQLEHFRAQLEASRPKADFWDVASHPMVVAIASLIFFSLIGMLWLREPVVRPPAPDDGPIAAAPTSEAVASERPVATSGLAAADAASAVASALPVATPTTPDSRTPVALPTTSGARPSAAISAATAASDRAVRPAAAAAPESNTAPAASEARAVAAAPDVRSTPASPDVSAAPVAPVPPPAPAAAPDASTQTVSAVPAAPPIVPAPAAVEPPQPRPQPVDQPAAVAPPPRAEEPQPPRAAPGASGQREAVLVSGPLPRFPESVKRIGQAGGVDVDVTIDPVGRVTRAEALNGPSLLRGFAEDAVLKWRYEPAVANGVPVESRRRVRIVFR